MASLQLLYLIHLSLMQLLLHGTLGYEDVRQVFLRNKAGFDSLTRELRETDCTKDLTYFYQRLDEGQEWAVRSE